MIGDLLIFGTGLFVGGLLGVTIIALCTISSDFDDIINDLDEFNKE